MKQPNSTVTGVVLALCACLASITCADSIAAGDPDRGREKSAICAACHGADGNSTVSIWPSIAGQHADYLRKQLEDIQSGTRINEQMTPIIKDLTTGDFEDLAAYYSGQTAADLEAAPETLEQGQRIFRAGNPDTGLPACMGCHGPAGSGNPAAGYPLVSGQHADYTAATLQAYRSSARSNDANGVMRAVASLMTDAEIRAVANYLQGLY